MSRTKPIMYDLRKMALIPSAASIILRMMKTCNDMQTANEALSHRKKKRMQQTTGRAHGGLSAPARASASSCAFAARMRSSRRCLSAIQAGVSSPR